MLSKKRSKPQAKGDRTLAQFGIIMPDLDDLDQEGDDDDDLGDGDLEAELQALVSGKAPQRKTPAPKKVAPDFLNVEKMAADCLKDIDSGEEDDGDLSGEDDLEAELQTLVSDSTERVSPRKASSPASPSRPAEPATSILDLLTERLKLYKDAESASKSQGDTSKARRFGRGVKTLEGLMKSAQAGHAISEEDIPPPVSIPKPKPPPPPPASEANDTSEGPADHVKESPPPLPPPRQLPSRPAPSLPDHPKKAAVLSVEEQLAKRRDQYKMAALRAKKSGDTTTAVQYVRIAKKFDAVIEAKQSGQPVDLSNMPPPPPGFADDMPSSINSTDAKAAVPKRENEQNQTTSQPTGLEAAALAAANEPEDPNLFKAPPPPSSVLEALVQRLDKFRSTCDEAKTQGNNSKARRLQRIIQQYEAAIKSHKAGKPVDYEELPAPPGFAPIPATGIAPKVPQAAAPATPKSQSPPSAAQPKKPAVQPAARPGAAQKGAAPAAGSKRTLVHQSSQASAQLNFLLERQKLFKEAALESKKKGDTQQALQYFKLSKGFDSMIEATKCGLPIDATSIPTPPQLESSDFVIIDKSECIDEEGVESTEELFRTIERDLEKQVELCKSNKEHFLRLGDVSSASKFEKLGLDSQKDLVVIRHKWANNETLPGFHYETRLFSMVQCHTDLGDNDIEVTIERGINLPGKPNDLDSYIRIEVPLPPESPFRAKTHTSKDTNNPIFQESFKFEFNRKSRSIIRHFKRQALRLEVWSKGGFLRSDTLLGVASVKLVDLETKCMIHDSYDLMDGRKACGGKIEIKVRIRDPLLAKQVEEVKEKWLVIGK